MKIAQVNVYFKPFMVGGAEWYVYNISRELARMGHEVHVFTTDECNGEKASSSKEDEIDGILVHRFPLRLNWSYRLKVWDKAFSKALADGRFDVIHTYDYPQWHTKTALKVAKQTHSGSVLTVFDVHSLIPRRWYKQIPMKLFERFFARRILNSADQVLVRAPNLVPALREVGVKEEKMLVTPSGVNDEALQTYDGLSFKKKYKIDGAPMILCLARLNPLKGQQHLLGAAKAILSKFPRACFVFVGADQSGYLSNLKALTSSLGIEEHVFFTGPIHDFKEKMQAYASCDVFVLPSSYEGTSQAIFEAMAHAKPVASTQVGGIPFQIENGKEGLLVPYNEQIETSLAEATLRILCDSGFGRDMGKRAREKVYEKFRYSILASQLIEIYEKTAMRTESPSVQKPVEREYLEAEPFGFRKLKHP